VDFTLHTPSDCELCELPLTWNIGPPGHQASHPVTCKSEKILAMCIKHSLMLSLTECHIKCHDYHLLLSGDSFSPCTGCELENIVT